MSRDTSTTQELDAQLFLKESAEEGFSGGRPSGPRCIHNILLDAGSLEAPFDPLRDPYSCGYRHAMSAGGDRSCRPLAIPAG
jgi:hypothetical protein